MITVPAFKDFRLIRKGKKPRVEVQVNFNCPKCQEMYRVEKRAFILQSDGVVWICVKCGNIFQVEV